MSSKEQQQPKQKKITIHPIKEYNKSREEQDVGTNNTTIQGSRTKTKQNDDNEQKSITKTQYVDRNQ